MKKLKLTHYQITAIYTHEDGSTEVVYTRGFYANHFPQIVVDRVANTFPDALVVCTSLPQ